MRLYSLTGAGAVDDPEFGHIEAAEDGGFDFPGPLADRLHSSGVRGARQWEDALERSLRLIREEAARRADPATLLEAVEKIQRLAAVTPEPAPAKPAPAKAAAAK